TGKINWDSPEGRRLDRWESRIRELENMLFPNKPSGIVHPSFARLINMSPTPHPTPAIVDATYEAWKNADWDSIGAHLDAYLDRYYDYSGVFADEKHIKISGIDIGERQRFNPVALQKMSRVQRVGDLIATDVYRWAEEAMHHPKPYEYVRAMVTFLT